MITPNQLKEAKQELSKYNLGKFEIPSEMQLAEKDHYLYIGLSASDDSSGLGKTVTARAVYRNQTEWQRIEKDLKKKSPLFDGQTANVFKKIVILHNPTLPLTEEKKEKEIIEYSGEGEPFETTGRMTPTKQESIDRMMEEGKGVDDFGLNQIAKDVNVSFSKVKEYIKSH